MDPLVSSNDTSIEREEQQRSEEKESLVAAAEFSRNKFEGGLDPTEAPSSDDDESSTEILPQNEYIDTISATIRERSGGIALYSVFGICTSMTVLSFFLLYQFQESTSAKEDANTDTVDSSIPSYPSDGMCSITTQQAQKPLWHDLLELQIDVIQNLVHASLLGAAALVAAIRGDAMWLYFTRNVAFFFFPIGLSYFLVDLHAVIVLGHELGALALRLIFAFAIALSSAIAFFKHDATCRQVRRTLLERLVTLNLECMPNPDGLAESRADMLKANVVFYGAQLVQVSALIYSAVTTGKWFHLSKSCELIDENRGLEGVMEMTEAALGDLLPFEMAYSSGAHQSLLLALLLLASTYPRHPASIGGAVLSSAWRLVVSGGSLLNIYLNWTTASSRSMYSLLFTSLEATAMVPILIASLLLAQNIRKQEETGGYEKLGKRDVESHLKQTTNVGDMSDNECCVHRYRCPSLSQIANSENYTARQRMGARLLSWSTVALLFGLTVECFPLLRQNFVGMNSTHEVYKWGMHISSIYVFCAIMAVETPFIYNRGRFLLFIACPAGSLVALWQLLTLVRYDDTEDSWAYFVLFLLAWRALCGLVQTVGLLILQNTEPASTRVASIAVGSAMEVIAARAKVRFCLFNLYIPAFVAYVLGVSVLGNCSEPMISSVVPTNSCSTTSMGFMMAQNWPGLGLFFHFGMLTIIFASTGLSNGVPSYKPSLAIASLFAGHVAGLILVDFLWDASQTHMWQSLSFADITRRFSLFLWMVTSGYLCFCLDRLWKLRLLPV